ncbi:GGDEF domain-containing protein [Consotaella salsifontis]|uniref:diguanylate cyclase n=1 Tax=Consotaella salsifontis TaxID=1365950 RepID=A0A1T4TEU2_9HYPH|nr:diguanylate cyclase [Consotaella salsifontis]SKA38994.1 diguanylate cyclase [Consotaella salsifontis]
MSFSDFLLRLVNDLGIFSLVVMCYGATIRRFQPGLVKFAILGLLFGAGTGFAMANGAGLMPGLLIDPRGVMLVLAGYFGGPIAAMAASAIATVARIWIDSRVAATEIAGIWAITVAGVVFARLFLPADGLASLRQFLALGVVASVPFAFALVSPVPYSSGVLLQAFLPLAIATVIGVVVLGHFLCAEQREIALKRKLEKEAFVDPLTNLPNRRKLERKAGSIIDDARRSGSPVSTLVIDIDRFKCMNDRFGHDVGDKVLKDVAAVVLANVRADDAVARYGGEEIVVVMPRTGLTTASVIADRIRAVVDQEVFHGDRDSGKVTVSVGVATHQGAGVSFKSLFKDADEALYRAKQRGRNRVELASPTSVSAVA